MREVMLSYLHILMILSMTVFLSAEAALCRQEWMNAKVVRRLVRLDLIYGVLALLTLLSGLARLFWGAKGLEFYLSNPVFHLKLTLFVLMLLLSIRPTLTFLRWRPALAAGQAPIISDRSARWVKLTIRLELLHGLVRHRSIPLHDPKGDILITGPSRILDNNPTLFVRLLRRQPHRFIIVTITDSHLPALSDDMIHSSL